MEWLPRFTWRGPLLIFASMLCASTCPADEPLPSKIIGKEIPGFELPDHHGKRFALTDVGDKRVVVLAFLGTECPLAKRYALRLSQLAEEYASRGVVVLGIDANCQDSLADIAAFVRLHELKFRFLKDSGNRVADLVGAVRTPEVFVLDAKRVVQYQGRIDDQYGIGYARKDPQRRDLVLALDALLSGQTVSVPCTTGVGCHIGRISRPQADSPVTYSNQIARIFARRCVECHRPGEIGPFSLVDYDEVVGWAATIAEVVKEERMPPWHASRQHGEFSNDRRLTDEEKELIQKWLEAGAPQGDSTQLPVPDSYVDGWQMPNAPDLVIDMAATPYEVPAEGVIQYKFFKVDPHFTEDKWVTTAEVRPGARAVVHHALVAIRPPGAESSNFGDLDGQMLGLYVPGMRPEPWPPGIAKRIPAGSQLVFELHYTPNGSVQQDCSRIGLVFTEAKSVVRAVITGKARQGHFSIPPGDANYHTQITLRPSPIEAELLTLMPHMHLRGKSFLYEAIYANGTRETLLDVPRYDFNWQTTYRLAHPKRIAAGTSIHCEATFDNSTQNPANPDPAATVTWGSQTWDEMMVGYFEYSVPVAVVNDAIRGADSAANGVLPLPANRVAQQRAAKFMKSYDKNGDGRVTASELPTNQQKVFANMDVNHDGGVTLEELVVSFLKTPAR